jgi:hypothetical protein
MARVTELKARGVDFGGGRFAPTKPSGNQNRPFEPAIGELKTKPVRSRRSAVPAAVAANHHCPTATFQPVSLPKVPSRTTSASL